MNLEELKRLLAEAKRIPPGKEPAQLIGAAVNALPELIAIAERTKGGTLQELMQLDAAAYAAGRADQRKADVEIAKRGVGPAQASARSVDSYNQAAFFKGIAHAAESIAKAIEEQGKDPSP